MVWPTLGSRTAKEQNRTALKKRKAAVGKICRKCRSVITSDDFAPGTDATCCDRRVCVFVSEHISKIRRPKFTRFLMRVASDRGSIILWRHNDTLCTSGLWTTLHFSTIASTVTCCYRCSDATAALSTASLLRRNGERKCRKL